MSDCDRVDGARLDRLDNDQTTTQVRPEDPIKWMSEYLRDNNPNVNPEAAARAAKRRRLDEEVRAAPPAPPATAPPAAA